MLADDKSGPRWAQLQSLNMLTCTEGKERHLGGISFAAQTGRIRRHPGANVQTRHSTRSWPANLPDKQLPLPAPPFTLISGQRRGQIEEILPPGGWSPTANPPRAKPAHSLRQKTTLGSNPPHVPPFVLDRRKGECRSNSWQMHLGCALRRGSDALPLLAAHSCRAAMSRRGTTVTCVRSWRLIASSATVRTNKHARRPCGSTCASRRSPRPNPVPRPSCPASRTTASCLKRICATDPDLQMPPPAANKPLSDRQRQILRDWIAAGAEYESHWAFQPPRQAALPTVRNANWPRNAIDYFVLAEIESGRA